MNTINSFSELLAQGQISEALQLRLEAIETSARYYRQDLEAAKVSSAALGVVGLLLSANPLVAVIAGCGLAGYGYTVLRDYQNTKRLCLLPLVRKGTGELLTGIGLAATNEQGEDDPLLGVIGYVEPELAHEYELVMVAEAQLTGYLGNLPGEARLNAYRHILRHTRLRNSLKLPPLQDVALAIASPIPPTTPTLPAVKPEPAPAIEVKAEVVEPAPQEPAIGTPYDEFKPPFVGHAPRDVRRPKEEEFSPPDKFPEPSQPAPTLDPTSEQVGLEILDGIVRTRRSTLLIGDTGAGKSVTQAYVLTKLFELQPNADVFVLAQKADSFCGLAEKGRVILFDPTDPEHALTLITNIWNVYDRRRRLPESERPALSPVRLILADWLSINQALEELFKTNETVKASRYLSKLADLIYNGRELNVCLLVDLQSYNLAAVGLKADRNSRKNFNLIGLGNYSIDELGMVNESYGVLTNLIGDRYIVAEESERSALNATFKQLQPISKANYRPIIFSGLSPARLALLPDLRRYKSSKVVSKQPTTVVEPTTKIGTSDDIRDRLEALIEATPKEKTQPQSALAKKLLEIIQSATKSPISFESIRKSRKWENGSPDKATLLAALEEITPDWIRGSEEEGYYIQD